MLLIFSLIIYKLWMRSRNNDHLHDTSYNINNVLSGVQEPLNRPANDFYQLVFNNRKSISNDIDEPMHGKYIYIFKKNYINYKHFNISDDSQPLSPSSAKHNSLIIEELPLIPSPPPTSPPPSTSSSSILPTSKTKNATETSIPPHAMTTSTKSTTDTNNNNIISKTVVANTADHNGTKSTVPIHSSKLPIKNNKNEKNKQILNTQQESTNDADDDIPILPDILQAELNMDEKYTVYDSNGKLLTQPDDPTQIVIHELDNVPDYQGFFDDAFKHIKNSKLAKTKA